MPNINMAVYADTLHKTKQKKDSSAFQTLKQIRTGETRQV